MLKIDLLNHGDIVKTDCQYDGKGSRGSLWESESGKNLTFSLVLFPDIPISQVFTLNMATALAIQRTVEEVVQERAFVKWPNDVYVRDKKVAGVLIENKIKGSDVVQAIVGIGLNVNQRKFSHEKATSLSLVSSLTYNLDHVMGLFKQHFERIYNQCGQQETSVKEHYHRALYKRGELSLIRDKAGLKWAVVDRVNDQGELMVWHGEEKMSYDIKELSLIR